MILFSIRIMMRTFPFSSACFLCCGLLPLPGFSPALSSPQKCISRGELQVSLSYQPVAQRMTVVVLKARHLPKMDITGLSGSSYLLQPISFFSFFLHFFFIGVYLLCNVVLVFTTQQSESAIRIHISPLFLDFLPI